LNVELDSLDEESIFYQLQNVFGHLLESKLQHYIPEKFWRTFRLFGQVPILKIAVSSF
jgi:ubiquitin carboxyl-terminal hydrolase 9/24